MITRYTPLVALLAFSLLGPLEVRAQENTSPVTPAASPPTEQAPTSTPSSEPAPNEEEQTTTARPYQSFNPDISVIPSFVFGWFNGRGDRAGTELPVTGFNFSELEIGFQAAIDPFFRADVITTWSPSEGFGPEEAYLTALALPWNLTAKAGKFRSSFGRHNAQHRHVWDYVDVPLVINRLLGNEGFSDLGAQISWLAPTPWYMEANLEVQQGTEGKIFGGTRGRDLLIAGTLKNSWDVGDETTILFGLSGASGPNGSSSIVGLRSYLFGTDLSLKWRPVNYGTYTGLNWQSEYFWARQEDAAGNTDSGGLYSQVTYKFTEDWLVSARGDLDGLPGTPDKRVSVALTNWPSEFSMFRLQYEYRFTNAAIPDPIHGVMLQMQFAIGAHGAHKF